MNDPIIIKKIKDMISSVIYGSIWFDEEDDLSIFNISLCTSAVWDRLYSNQNIGDKYSCNDGYVFEFHAEDLENQDLIKYLREKWNRKWSVIVEILDDLEKCSIEVINKDNANETVIVYGYLLYTEDGMYEQIGCKLIISEGNLLYSESSDKHLLMHCLVDQDHQFNDENIKSDIINQLSSIKNVAGIVYNVGQGNCVRIIYGGENNILVDVGRSYRIRQEEKEKIDKSYEQIKNIQPKIIILTHWDVDHIIGYKLIGYKDKSYDPIASSYWVVPDLSKVPQYNLSGTAKNLFHKLVASRRVYICDNYGKNVFNAGIFSIYQGSGKKGKSTVSNNIGLIIKIKYNGIQNCILMGDCSYSEMPQELNRESAHVLVTSHHGSDKTLPTIKSDEDGVAVISVGINNSYHHPGNKHIEKLRELGYACKVTRDVYFVKFSKNDVFFCLDKENNHDLSGQILYSWHKDGEELLRFI